jgi:hypothetical protein
MPGGEANVESEEDRRAARVLAGLGFSSAEPGQSAYRFGMLAARLPVEVLAREVTMVFGTEYLGGDKMAWR